MTDLLACQDLDIAVQGRALVSRLQLDLAPGALVAVVGPNGVGKSLTLETLAGLRPAAGGAVWITGHPAESLGRRAVARTLGLLLQESDESFPSTVLESVLLGRYATLGAFGREGPADRDNARRTLASLDLAHLADRPPATLSGGERRRLQIARLLVQDPQVLLLDEPMNHLDPLHQVAVLRTLGRLAAEGKAVMATLHDPALAARCFDSCLILHGDGRWQFGPVAQLLTTGNLTELFRVPFGSFRGEHETLVLPDWPSRPRVIPISQRAAR